MLREIVIYIVNMVGTFVFLFLDPDASKYHVQILFVLSFHFYIHVNLFFCKRFNFSESFFLWMDVFTLKHVDLTWWLLV